MKITDIQSIALFSGEDEKKIMLVDVKKAH